MNQDNLDNSTRAIQKSIAQLVHVVDTTKIQPLGSAILLKLDNKLRLLSAGHLINLADFDKILMPLPDTQEGLYIDTFGDLASTNIEPDQENNEIDFAEIKFTNEDKVQQVVKHYTPIPENRVTFEHKITSDDYRIFLFGYPNSKTKFDFNKKKIITAQPLRIVTSAICDEEFYKRNGYSTIHHILLKIQRKTLVGHNRVFLPKTKGLSGSGVYFLPNLNSTTFSDDFRLIGILTEVDFEKQFAVVVKIKTIYDILEPPHLGSNKVI